MVRYGEVRFLRINLNRKENGMSKTQTARPWPLDFDGLKKGDVISIEVIERIANCKCDTTDYALKAMALAEKIMCVKKEHLEPVTAKVEKGTIRILLDHEATVYNDKTVRAGLRKIGRGCERMSEVDTRQLTGEQHNKHLRRLEVNSRTFQGALMGRRGELPGKQKVAEIAGAQNN